MEKRSANRPSKKQTLAMAAIGLIALAGGALVAKSMFFMISGKPKPMLQEVDQSPGCASAKPVPFLSVFGNRIRKQEEYFEVGVGNFCYMRGQVLPIQRKRFVLTQDQVSSALPLPQALTLMIPVSAGIGEIIQVIVINQPPKEIDADELAQALNTSDTENLGQILRANIANEVTAPWTLFKVRIQSDSQVLHSREKPYAVDLTRGLVTVNVDGGPMMDWGGNDKLMLSKSLAEGATLIDIRSESEFKKYHHPQAVHVPYSEAKPVNLSSIATYFPDPSADTFNLEGLPEDKTKTIIFVGAGNHDTRTYKAFVLAQLKGWSQAKILHGGARALTGTPLRTPEQIPGVESVSAKDAAKLILDARTEADATVFVDVRSRAEFELDRIKGSHSIHDPDIALQVPDTLNIDEPLAESDQKALHEQMSWKLSHDVKTIVMYGADDMDWRPLNLLSSMARSYASAKILWLRGGFGSWLTMHDLEPSQFQTTQDLPTASGAENAEPRKTDK